MDRPGVQITTKDTMDTREHPFPTLVALVGRYSAFTIIGYRPTRQA
jgi:hypothetical protein